jgi:hypothetical protein
MPVPVQLPSTTVCTTPCSTLGPFSDPEINALHLHLTVKGSLNVVGDRTHQGSRSVSATRGVCRFSDLHQSVLIPSRVFPVPRPLRLTYISNRSHGVWHQVKAVSQPINTCAKLSPIDTHEDVTHDSGATRSQSGVFRGGPRGLQMLVRGPYSMVVVNRRVA